MAILKATDHTLDQIIKSNRIVLVDFWAPWCGPCHTLAPILDQLALEAKSVAVITKLNVIENPVSAIRHHLQGVPTLKLFVDGREVKSFLGVQPLSKLKEAIFYFAD